MRKIIIMFALVSMAACSGWGWHMPTDQSGISQPNRVYPSAPDMDAGPLTLSK